MRRKASACDKENLFNGNSMQEIKKSYGMPDFDLWLRSHELGIMNAQKAWDTIML